MQNQSSCEHIKLNEIELRVLYGSILDFSEHREHLCTDLSSSCSTGSQLRQDRDLLQATLQLKAEEMEQGEARLQTARNEARRLEAVREQIEEDLRVGLRRGEELAREAVQAGQDSAGWRAKAGSAEKRLQALRQSHDIQ
jgi:hypothetical protein